MSFIRRWDAKISDQLKRILRSYRVIIASQVGNEFQGGLQELHTLNMPSVIITIMHTLAHSQPDLLILG
jgi:hypothetical protein